MTHSATPRVPLFCSYRILTSSVIYYWIRRTATWNLFVLYNNEKPFYFKINISTQRESRPFAPPLHEKKQFDVIYLQNEAISLVAMRSKELWLVEKNRTTVKSDSSPAPRLMKTYSESRIGLLQQLVTWPIISKLLAAAKWISELQRACSK